MAGMLCACAHTDILCMYILWARAHAQQKGLLMDSTWAKQVQLQGDHTNANLASGRICPGWGPLRDQKGRKQCCTGFRPMQAEYDVLSRCPAGSQAEAADRLAMLSAIFCPDQLSPDKPVNEAQGGDQEKFCMAKGAFWGWSWSLDQRQK